MNRKLSRAETADARRKHIITSAAICFIEHGFHNTGIRDIATRADVSLGNIYNHFEGKNDLIAAIASLEAEELAGLQSRLSNSQSPMENIDEFVDSYLKLCCRAEYAALSLEILAETMRNPKIAEGFIANRENLLMALENQIAAARERSKNTSNLTDVECAEFILHLIEGSAFGIVLKRRRPDKKESLALKTAVKRLL